MKNNARSVANDQFLPRRKWISLSGDILTISATLVTKNNKKCGLLQEVFLMMIVKSRLRVSPISSNCM